MRSPELTPEISYYEISHQQVLEEDHAVFSIQWVTIPAVHAPVLTAEQLMQLYLAYIRRFTLTLVRPEINAAGVIFRLLATPVRLLTFNPPEASINSAGSRIVLRIAGGILVQTGQCDRGQLDFLVDTVDDGLKLTLQLDDYCPLLLGSPRPSRWRKWLYRLTQAYIHKVVTVRFLARVCRELTGSAPKIKVVRATLRSGEET